MIKFNEKYHSYTNSFTGEKYISATTLIHKFTKPFDTEKHAKRVAEREGTTTEEIKKQWKEEGKKGTGDLIQRLWETVEVQAVHIKKLNLRLKALEAA